MSRCWPKKRAKVKARANGFCQICGKEMSERQTSIDHIVPLCLGGTDAYSNLRAVHKRCNTDKNKFEDQPKFLAIKPG